MGVIKTNNFSLKYTLRKNNVFTLDFERTLFVLFGPAPGQTKCAAFFIPHPWDRLNLGAKQANAVCVAGVEEGGLIELTGCLLLSVFSQQRDEFVSCLPARAQSHCARKIHLFVCPLNLLLRPPNIAYISGERGRNSRRNAEEHSAEEERYEKSPLQKMRPFFLHKPG